MLGVHGLVAGVSLFASAPPTSTGVVSMTIYVSCSTGNDQADGSTRATAFQTLQRAQLAVAAAHHQADAAGEPQPPIDVRIA